MYICLSAHTEQLSPFQQIFVKLMLYRQIVTAYCEHYAKHKYIVVIIRSFNVQACDTYSKHSTFNC